MLCALHELELGKEPEIEVPEAGGAAGDYQVLGDLFSEIWAACSKGIVDDVLDGVARINPREEQLRGARLERLVKREKLTARKRVLYHSVILGSGSSDPAALLLDVSYSVLSVVALCEIDILLGGEVLSQFITDLSP